MTLLQAKSEGAQGVIDMGLPNVIRKLRLRYGLPIREIERRTPRPFISAMIQLLSNALSASSASKLMPSIRGATPAVSKRCPGSRTKRTRLPSASVSARILVVQPPFDLPIA